MMLCVSFQGSRGRQEIVFPLQRYWKTANSENCARYFIGYSCAFGLFDDTKSYNQGLQVAIVCVK